MSLPGFQVWCEIVCGWCAEHGPGHWINHRLKKMELRDEALRAKWIFAHGEVFCSQRCVNSYTDENRITKETGDARS
jgi:hypothetical protein